MSRTTLTHLGAVSRSTINDKFKYDPATTTGLTFGFDGATYALGPNPVIVAAGTVLLTDDATNIVEVSSGGVVSAVVIGSEGQVPLYKVVTASGVITTITDLRATYQQ